jgi:hypothetical protein
LCAGALAKMRIQLVVAGVTSGVCRTGDECHHDKRTENAKHH